MQQENFRRLRATGTLYSKKYNEEAKMKGQLRAGLVAGTILTGLGGTAARADVILSGPDANDGSYSTSELASFATSSNTVSDGTLQGISLWGLLGGANATSSNPAVYGAITTSTPAGDNGKNAILRYYLLGTSASGAHSVISLGEIDPNFGGTATPPAFVAFEDTSNTLLGVPELVVPSGAGRDLSNLVSLQLLAVAALPTGPGGQSNSVALSGPVANPGSYTKTDLQNDFTPTNELVNGDTYTGVPLWQFIGATGNDITNELVITAGTDGYEVALSLAELDPTLGGNPANFLPYADTGTNFPTAGVARTLFPNDNAHGRWESNLDVVQVVDLPEPGSLPVLLAALLALGYRRTRRAL
jgi:hypothetical protein